MTYIVSSGTLNPTIPYHTLYIYIYIYIYICLSYLFYCFSAYFLANKHVHNIRTLLLGLVFA